MIADVLKTQGDLLKLALERPAATDNRRSTIRVEPRVVWPKLSDDGQGGREVEEFYEKFEEICGLANNGKGMSDREMMVALKSCIHGSRRKIFENIVRANQGQKDEEEFSHDMYHKIKQRLFRFLETSTEKQLRVRNEWNALIKTRHMNSVQFEAEWEQCHYDMCEVGLEVSPQEKFLAYICKIGSPISDKLRLDRRPRPSKADPRVMETRLPETWEELHAVLCELESVNAGSRAFHGARAAGMQQVQDENWTGGQGPKGGGKKGKGKKGDGKGEGKGDRACYEFRHHGTCRFGDTCKYSHDPKDTGRQLSGALTKQGRLDGLPEAAPKAKPKKAAKTPPPPEALTGAVTTKRHLLC